MADDGNPYALSEDEYEAALEELREFDLSRVNRRLENQGVDDVEELERQFRRFVKYKMDNPDETVAPTPELDRYWHAFILDTKLYHDFCDRIFGAYLHHEPNLDPADGNGGDHSHGKR